jgi:hypothetical protein
VNVLLLRLGAAMVPIWLAWTTTDRRITAGFLFRVATRSGSIC